MKLYRLRANYKNKGSKGYNPFDYDCYHGFLVRANNEDEARRVASESAFDEGAEAWLDSNLSYCDELSLDGPLEILLSDFHAG